MRIEKLTKEEMKMNMDINVKGSEASHSKMKGDAIAIGRRKMSDKKSDR